MLYESAIVRKIDQTAIWVEIYKASACGSCMAQKSCGQKLLAAIGQGKPRLMTVQNPDNLSVQIDDEVQIAIEEGAFLKASALMYILPLFTLFFVAALASFFALTEFWVLIASLVGLGLGLILVRFISRQYMSSSQYQPQLCRLFS